MRQKSTSHRLPGTALLLVEEVARRLRSHPETIRRRLRDKRLNGLKLGRVWRIERSEVERVVEHGGL